MERANASEPNCLHSPWKLDRRTPSQTPLPAGIPHLPCCQCPPPPAALTACRTTTTVQPALRSHRHRYHAWTLAGGSLHLHLTVKAVDCGPSVKGFAYICSGSVWGGVLLSTANAPCHQSSSFGKPLHFYLGRGHMDFADVARMGQAWHQQAMSLVLVQAVHRALCMLPNIRCCCACRGPATGIVHTICHPLYLSFLPLSGPCQTIFSVSLQQLCPFKLPPVVKCFISGRKDLMHIRPRHCVVRTERSH